MEIGSLKLAAEGFLLLPKTRADPCLENALKGNTRKKGSRPATTALCNVRVWPTPSIGLNSHAMAYRKTMPPIS